MYAGYCTKLEAPGVVPGALGSVSGGIWAPSAVALGRWDTGRQGT